MFIGRTEQLTALLYDGQLSPVVEAERYFDFVLDTKSLLWDDGTRRG